MSLPRSFFSKVLALGAYLVFLSLLCAGSLEVAARMGLPNSYHRVKLDSMASMREARTIVILGDSFSVPEWEGLRTFADLLREQLEQVGVNTVNLASSGTGPLDYLDSYRKYGMRSQPDVVLLDYYVGNDISDTIARTENDSWLKQAVRSASICSYLANVVMELRASYRTRARLAEIDVEAFPEASRPLNPFLVETARRNPRYLSQNLSLIDAESSSAWVRNSEALLELRDLVRSTGAELIINIFPHTAQVNSHHYEFFRAVGLEVDERDLVENLPQRKLLDFCAENGIRCVDLLPVFRSKLAANLYLDNDDHWNAEGHRLGFSVVWQTLSSPELGLVAPKPGSAAGGVKSSGP